MFRFLVCFVVGLMPAAYAASFDCAKAVRPVEKVICSDAKLSAADGAMAAAYRADLSRLSSAGVGQMRVDQVQWLAWAQMVCRVEDAEVKRGDVAACLQPVYADRVKALRGAVRAAGDVRLVMRTQYLAVPDDGERSTHGDFPGFGTMTATWPRADSGDPLWITWSAAVEARMLHLAGSTLQITSTKDAPKQLPSTWTDNLAQAADVHLVATLKSAEHGRVTTVISTEGMAHGGAHAFGSSDTLTWLLEQKRALRATDVFKDGPWQHRLGEICWTQLHRNADKRSYLFPEVNGPDAKGLQDVIRDVTNWTLEADGLHISYPDYAVAPRVAAPDDAVVAWGDLKGLLVDGFVTP